MTGARSHSGTKTDKSQDHSPSVTQTARLPSKRQHKKHEQTGAGIHKEQHTPRKSQQYLPQAADSQTKPVEFPRREWVQRTSKISDTKTTSA